MDASPPLILLTNDDGVDAPGLAALQAAFEDQGEVWVVAPDANRSGVSQKITLSRPLRVHRRAERVFAVTGSPTDCVYLAVHEILPRPAALLVSGTNAGPNMSYDTLYSGTVGAAREGTMQSIPSIAMSAVHPTPEAYDKAAAFAVRLGAVLLRGRGLPGVTLNVNVPQDAGSEYMITRLGQRMFHHAVHRRTDPRGGSYYWIGGAPARPRELEGTDCWAVDRGVVSITPLSLDMTEHSLLEDTAQAIDIDGARPSDA